MMAWLAAAGALFAGLGILAIVAWGFSWALAFHVLVSLAAALAFWRACDAAAPQD
jgi:succinate dehydrogenase/fumarate reductase cytochrome b subunit